MKITFLGAARTVTGSSYLIETGKTKFLVDGGMFQGRDVELRNLEPLIYDPRKIDFIIVTHAHMDHTGLLPRIVKEGFRGDIYMTPPTAALSEILLIDAAKIQENNAKSNQLNEKYSEAMPYKVNVALYTTQDSVDTINMMKSVDFDVETKIGNNISFTYLRAGHILGAASVKLNVEGKTLVFSGDLGRNEQSIVKKAELPENIHADVIVMESLYGGVEHPLRKKSIKSLLRTINTTLNRDGNVIIPCFALHRTQEILEILKYAYEKGSVDQTVQVFLDSPLAIAATKIYTQHSGYFNSGTDYIENDHGLSQITPKVHKNGGDRGVNRFDFEQLQIVKHHRQSLKLLKRKKSIIIAGSGMAEGGRILHHIAANAPSPDSSIVFVGYQAEGTLGRKIVDGAKTVRINKRKKRINATVKYIRGFSAHADNSDLLEWLGNIKISKEAKIYLVHAEPERSEDLKDQLLATGIRTAIPDWKETVIIK
ncbi:MAG: MBL fold metallo-hydrolase [Candidatus Dojkabacteria bacterium]